MAETSYEYSIQNDFPNHKVDSDRLSAEIRSSEIVTAFDHIDTSGDVCTIWFKAALSQGDETVLDVLVAAHSGEALPSTSQLVTLAGVPTTDDGKLQLVPNLLPGWSSLYFAGQGDDRTNGVGAGTAFKASSEVEGDTSVEWIFTDQIHLVGGSLLFSGGELGDWLDYSVSAPATVTGQGTTAVALVPYGPGNVIVPNPQGTETIDLSSVVGLVPTSGSGYWDWDNPTQGLGTVTPNYTGTGGYTLFDFEVPLGRPLVKLHVLGAGKVDFLMANITPMKALPHWKHKAVVHNSGHAGLKVTWMFVGGRGGAI